MTENNKIVMLPRTLLHPHPDNPRKDLGDLTELKESIREHGVMQNLTVVPDKDDGDGYTILIGHRRFAASEGILDELPCVVAKGLTDREQVGIMLCENIQRSDLTFVEQAHGFQMMLDLGDTVETISQKTGFSSKTIKHRLEIAKLSDKAINSERGWQLSLSDLIELEKVPNVKDRDRILKECSDSNNFKWRIRTAVQEANEKKNIKKAAPWLKKLEIKEDNNSAMWQEGVNQRYKIELGEDDPKDLTLEKLEQLSAKYPKLFYQVKYKTLILFTKSKEKKEKPKLTAAEIARAEKVKKMNEIEAYRKQACKTYAEFLFTLPINEARRITSPDLIENIWKYLLQYEVSLGCYNLSDYIKDYTERKKFFEETLPTWPTAMQMLVPLCCQAYGENIIYYSEEFDPKTADLNKFIIKSLEQFGYNFPEELPQGLFDENDEMFQFLKKGGK